MDVGVVGTGGGVSVGIGASGVDVGVSVAEIAVGVAGAGVAVGALGVAVGGIGVGVAGAGVAVGVGASGVGVSSAGVAVAGTTVGAAAHPASRVTPARSAGLSLTRSISRSPPCHGWTQTGHDNPRVSPSPVSDASSKSRRRAMEPSSAMKSAW